MQHDVEQDYVGNSTTLTHRRIAEMVMTKSDAPIVDTLNVYQVAFNRD